MAKGRRKTLRVRASAVGSAAAAQLRLLATMTLTRDVWTAAGPVVLTQPESLPDAAGAQLDRLEAVLAATGLTDSAALP